MPTDADFHREMEHLAQRFGKPGMQAIASLMHDMGSTTTIQFEDGTWLPCDFLMQWAWEHGGKPDPEPQSVGLPFERVPQCGCDPGFGDPPTKQQMMECKLSGGPCSPNHVGSNEPSQ